MRNVGTLHSDHPFRDNLPNTSAWLVSYSVVTAPAVVIVVVVVATIIVVVVVIYHITSKCN